MAIFYFEPDTFSEEGVHYKDIVELQTFVKDNEELTDMLMQKLKTFMAGMAIQCREKR